MRNRINEIWELTPQVTLDALKAQVAHPGVEPVRSTEPAESTIPTDKVPPPIEGFSLAEYYAGCLAMGYPVDSLPLTPNEITAIKFTASSLARAMRNE